MNLLEMLVLAVVQGIAEFLPISSSGHLVILGRWLRVDSDSSTVEIILHAGTLASILVVYWGRIGELLRSDRRLLPLLVVGTLPAALLGVWIKTRAEWLLNRPLLAGVMLIVTGLMLWLLRWLPEGQRGYRQIAWPAALLIGCFQAFALLPGVSRSGSTIVGARLCGLQREDAVTFSFLLAIPAILGATCLALLDLVRDGADSQQWGVLLIGAAVAFLVGVAALRWLIHWARTGRLSWFAWWCIPFGILVIVLVQSGVL
jgi:undecaprenyl-diphosphatase